MNFYFNLEFVFVVTDLLCVWLKMKDLGKLDSALCNKNERKSFMILILNPFAAMDGLMSDIVFAITRTDEKYQCWLLKRNVSVKHINVNRTTLGILYLQ
jgi:hypothetical protein